LVFGSWRVGGHGDVATPTEYIWTEYVRQNFESDRFNFKQALDTL
jgi:hypothetical protein